MSDAGGPREFCGKGTIMRNVLQIVLLILAVSGIAAANDFPTAVPEIDATGLVTAVGLLAGGLLVMRARRK